MNERLKKFGILILMLAIALLIISWFTVFNKGTIIVETGIENYKIRINEDVIDCINDPCVISKKIGKYEIKFEKDGYNPITSNVAVERGEKTPVVLSPKKTIKLEESTVYKKDEVKPSIQAPFNVEIENIIASSWNTDQTIFLYLDSSDDRLKLTDKTGEEYLITNLRNITPPLNLYWSPDERKILAQQNKDLYFIGIEEGSRKKNIISIKPENILWSPDSNYILFNNGEKLYRIDWTDFYKLNELNLYLNLNNSLWLNKDILITYTFNEEDNKSIIWTYDPINETKEIIKEKFNFKIGEMDFNKDSNTLFIYNTHDQKWYEIKMD